MAKTPLHWDGAKLVVDPNALAVGTTAYSASLTLSGVAPSIHDVTLTGPLTLTFSAGSAAQDGQVVRCRFRQDGTGGRVLTLGTGIRVGTDIPSVTLSTAASKMDYLAFQYCHADAKYDLISYVRGF
jgi:hypothetical protein